jgi:uncharacterized alkaline shock family protein YloU
VPSATDSSQQTRGRGSIDQRKVGRTIREAAAACYGVASVVGPRWYQRLAARLGLSATPGVAVEADGGLKVTLDLHVAPSVPQAQVATNVAEVVRYRVQRDLGRTIDRLTVRVDGRPLAVSDGAASASVRQS